MNLHAEALLEDYRQQLPIYQQLKETVMHKLNEIKQQAHIELNSMEARIKDETSLIGKLERKGDKYASLTDITDIFGARIITFYNEDVDRIASIIEAVFDIDWQNSVDKRKMHEFDSFGYNSLHYICRLPANVYHDPQHPEINEIRFELQMRTALQHVWSVIQHDIGYKTEIEIPSEYHRNLSRLAGLLELADNEFSRTRNAISEYRRRAQQLVQSGRLEEVMLDVDTFRSYLGLHPFDKLNRKIAAITQAEIQPTSLMKWLPVLRLMGMNTLADIEHMITNYEDNAYQLALFQLGNTDIDILSESVALQNLCIVFILKNGGGKNGLVRLFDAINGRSDQNIDLANIIIEQARRLAFTD